MSDEINEQQPQQPTEDETTPESETPVAVDADGWHTELALESQRYVWLLTAPDGSKHVAHSEDEIEQLKADHGK